MLKHSIMGEKIDIHPTTKVERIEHDEVEDSTLRQISFIIICFLLGFIMPRTSVYGGMAPFGVAFAAVVPGGGAIAVYISSIIGYMLPGGASMPLRYVAALAAVAGIKWSLNGVKSIAKSKLFPSLITFLAIEFTGFAIAGIGGIDLYKVILVVAEGLLGAAASYFFMICFSVVKKSADKKALLTSFEQASFIMTGAVILVALSSFSISGISPGRILTGIAILLLARCGKEQTGSIAGIVLGATIALSSPDHVYMAVGFALGGLTAGLFSRYGRFASASAFIIAHLITGVAGGVDVAFITGIYEVTAAAILFVVIPTSVDQFIQKAFINSSDIPAVEGFRRSVTMRLDSASNAMKDVSQTVSSVSKKLAGLSAPDITTIYRGVSDEICRGCGMNMFCWESSFIETTESFNALTPTLRTSGSVTRRDVPEHLTKHCTRLDPVIKKINDHYSEFTVREGAFKRISEIRSVVNDQFRTMADILEELSDGFAVSEKVDPESASRVINVCEEFGLVVQDALCLIGMDGTMIVEILASDNGVNFSRDKWQKSMSEACGRNLDYPIVTRLRNTVKISITEKPKFLVKIGAAQLKCEKEKLCGDSYEVFSDGSGCWYSVLSDGMGSGGRAAVDGAMAAGLAMKLIQAGFSAETVVKMINSALMVKSGDESLATLDIIEINMFTGKLECRKSGASPSLLLSKGRVSKIDKTALPLGILRDSSVEITTDTLVDKDVLLLMSDGVISEGIEWVEEELLNFNGEQDTVQKLAENIAIRARRGQIEKQDDITVISIMVEKV